MFIATIAKEIPLPLDQMILLNVVGCILLIIGVMTYSRLIRRVNRDGGHVRSELLGLPDILVAVTLAVLLGLLLLLQWFAPETAHAHSAGESPPHEIKGIHVIYGALQFALPVLAILALLIGRNISPIDVFGLKRVGFFHALALAGALLLLLLPIFLMVTAVAYQFLGEHAEQQELVKVYQHAAKAGKRDIIWQVAIAAVCIAPVTEEILFRGYFYPVFKRLLGPLPAAFGTSFLFAAIHNNALGFPGLALLALALTLVYERTGSIIVPIFMHAWFNGANLFFMWWAAQHDFVK